ncbi:MAG: hypothetical protein Q3971_02935 [Moraxella sp.]|nr:hypothetical protein [Moraxella sp.]
MSILAKILTQSSRQRTYNPNRLPTPHALYGRFGIDLRGNGWNMVRLPIPR